MSIILTIFAVILSLLFPKPVEAYSVAGQSGVLKEETQKQDQRKTKLKSFLRAQNSPLAVHSDKFIEEADKYGIDWRLLPAISGIESSYGKRIIPNSFNAYGWGGGKIRFASWEDSIEKVSKALAEKYYARGLNTPQKMNPVYCPPNKAWAGKVLSVMQKIENFKPRLSYSLIELSI